MKNFESNMEAIKKDKQISISNACIGMGFYRNFGGAKSQFNPLGDRLFNIILEEPLALALEEEGLNVKQKGSEEDPYYILQVKVSYNKSAPTIAMLTKNKKRVDLTIKNVHRLDSVDIITADIVLNLSNWSVNGKTGVKAYLSELYVTIKESPFADKYSDYESDESYDIIEGDEIPFD